MFEFSCLWPLWLLPLPFLIRFILPIKKEICTAAVRVPFFDHLQRLASEDKHPRGRLMVFYWFVIIYAGIVFALAGPRWIGKLQPLTKEGHNIMLALDLSGSMALNDMRLKGAQVMRLTVVKETAKQFIYKRAGDRLGLILFGTRAYLQTPLTYDHTSILQRLDEAVVGLAGQTTSLGDALGLAVKHLKKTPAKARVVILLTDGANNSGILPPLKAAELAVFEQIKVYTIGLGSDRDPSFLKGMLFDRPPSADLDEKTLKEIAKITGGHYFRAADTQSLQRIYQKINALESLSQEFATVRPQEEYYIWPLGGALFLLFAWLWKQWHIRRQHAPHKNRQEQMQTQQQHPGSFKIGDSLG